MTGRTADEMATTALRMLRSAQANDPAIAIIGVGFALLALYEQNEEHREDGIAPVGDPLFNPDGTPWKPPARPVGLDIRHGNPTP